MTKFFLNERNIYGIIALNVLVIVLQSMISSPWLDQVELLLSLLFIWEITLKIYVKKAEFFKDSWDIIDLGLCVIITTITILIWAKVLETTDLTVMGLRMIRIFKVLRSIRFIKTSGSSLSSLRAGLKACCVFFPMLIVSLFIFAIISMLFFQRLSPEYFGNIVRAFTTTVDIFLVEGWNEIPESIELTGISKYLMQAYFILQVLIGGFVVLPLVIDTFMSDNNDALEKKVDTLLEGNTTLEKRFEVLEGRVNSIECKFHYKSAQ
ncbi:MAG: ion transporter [Candidatus Peribacteria bacterium]|jgi:hypothetical protein|nr:ion transporter [Candidatus Peribacteria bacterium]